jgi:hypothetical protein
MFIVCRAEDSQKRATTQELRQYIKPDSTGIRVEEYQIGGFREDAPPRLSDLWSSRAAWWRRHTRNSDSQLLVVHHQYAHAWRGQRFDMRFSFPSSVMVPCPS